MQITTTRDEVAQSIRRLKFPPQIEADFQQYYYSHVRIRVRLSLFITVGAVIASLVATLSQGISTGVSGLCVIAFINFLLLVFSFHREFENYWQPVVVGAMSTSLLTGLLTFDPNEHNWYSLIYISIYYGLIVFQVFRFQVRWLLLQTLALSLCHVIFGIIQSAKVGHVVEGMYVTNIASSLASSFIMMALPLFLTYRNERGERTRFADKLLLVQDRDLEQQKREQTEKMLHILSQAIGGIVHDLGNPLTAVQGGAETLGHFIKEDTLDKDTGLEFVEMITDGAQMLNYLRLSLMEQTRVLEGRPIPVELQSTDVRYLVKAGAHYQKPRFSAGRQVSLEGEDLQLRVDEMRFITVFMNLIGNALKYSDGEVKVTWRTDAERILIGVLDQGQKGRGISKAEAEKLFVPFGRLDTHAQVEGTGLGLLSVRKIAEAHEGEVYIEGHTDGTSQSPIFCTAQGTYPQILQEGFSTAFVTVCPWGIAPQLPSPESELSSPAKAAEGD